MLREFLSNISLTDLPVVAMIFFLIVFLLVVWRVTRRSRREFYERISRLPLDEGERTDS